jgi:hypothetical protein
MASSVRFVKILFLLFFFQDIFNVVLLKLDLVASIPAFSALKEAVIVLLLAHYWMRASPQRPLDFTSLFLVVLLAALFVIGVWRGVQQFPLDGVLFELRTLALPILIFFWGRAFVEAGRDAAPRVEALVRFYTNVACLIAASAIFDYFFLGDEFWTWVDVGAVSRAKGYLAASSGALPDNMYSFFFGRRAFGLSFNPLNLAYLLIPALLFAYYRKQLVRLLLAASAFVLSFSRLPILATIATLMLAVLPVGVRIIAVLMGAIGVGIAVYAIREILFADPSASGHFDHVAFGMLQQLMNPLGEGIGAAGVYAGNYSVLAIESAVLNTATQITLLGLLAYALVFSPGLRRGGPLYREMRLMAGIYAITAVFAPQILVIKSTFAFFFFLGANAALAGRSLPALAVPPGAPRGPRSLAPRPAARGGAGQRQPV